MSNEKIASIIKAAKPQAEKAQTAYEAQLKNFKEATASYEQRHPAIVNARKKEQEKLDKLERELKKLEKERNEIKRKFEETSSEVEKDEGALKKITSEMSSLRAQQPMTKKTEGKLEELAKKAYPLNSKIKNAKDDLAKVAKAMTNKELEIGAKNIEIEELQKTFQVFTTPELIEQEQQLIAPYVQALMPDVYEMINTGLSTARKEGASGKIGHLFLNPIDAGSAVKTALKLRKTIAKESGKDVKALTPDDIIKSQVFKILMADKNLWKIIEFALHDSKKLINRNKDLIIDSLQNPSTSTMTTQQELAAVNELLKNLYGLKAIASVVQSNQGAIAELLMDAKMREAIIKEIGVDPVHIIPFLPIIVDLLNSIALDQKPVREIVKLLLKSQEQQGATLKVDKLLPHLKDLLFPKTPEGIKATLLPLLKKTKDIDSLILGMIGNIKNELSKVPSAEKKAELEKTLVILENLQVLLPSSLEVVATALEKQPEVIAQILQELQPIMAKPNPTPQDLQSLIALASNLLFAENKGIAPLLAQIAGDETQYDAAQKLATVLLPEAYKTTVPQLLPQILPVVQQVLESPHLVPIINTVGQITFDEQGQPTPTGEQLTSILHNTTAIVGKAETISALKALFAKENHAAIGNLATAAAPEAYKTTVPQLLPQILPVVQQVLESPHLVPIINTVGQITFDVQGKPRPTGEQMVTILHKASTIIAKPENKASFKNAIDDNLLGLLAKVSPKAGAYIKEENYGLISMVANNSLDGIAVLENFLTNEDGVAIVKKLVKFEENLSAGVYNESTNINSDEYAQLITTGLKVLATLNPEIIIEVHKEEIKNLIVQERPELFPTDFEKKTLELALKASGFILKQETISELQGKSSAFKALTDDKISIQEKNRAIFSLIGVLAKQMASEEFKDFYRTDVQAFLAETNNSTKLADQIKAYSDKSGLRIDGSRMVNLLQQPNVLAHLRDAYLDFSQGNYLKALALGAKAAINSKDLLIIIKDVVKGKLVENIVPQFLKRLWMSDKVLAAIAKANEPQEQNKPADLRKICLDQGKGMFIYSAYMLRAGNFSGLKIAPPLNNMIIEDFNFKEATFGTKENGASFAGSTIRKCDFSDIEIKGKHLDLKDVNIDLASFKSLLPILVKLGNKVELKNMKFIVSEIDIEEIKELHNLAKDARYAQLFTEENNLKIVANEKEITFAAMVESGRSAEAGEGRHK